MVTLAAAGRGGGGGAAGVDWSKVRGEQRCSWMKQTERGMPLLSFSILPLSLPHWAALLLIGRLDSMTRVSKAKAQGWVSTNEQEKKNVYVGVYKMCLSIQTQFKGNSGTLQLEMLMLL